MYNKSNEFLDIAYNKQLREAINSSPLYAYDENHKSIYNLSCAVMDRLNSCILYLNSHASTPSTEEDFISFMVFACMTIDATKQLLKGLNTEYSLGNEKKYFKNVCEENNFILPNGESPTDDEFFQYFRALVFAHPLETSRAKFLEKGEIEYSPWVIVNNELASLLRVCDRVGVRVYSNKYTEIRDITFSFSKLKGYISARYKLIKCAINAINNEVTAKQEEFRKDKINRNQSPVEILNEINEKLENRFERVYEINTMISCLTCPLSTQTNANLVEKYRKDIIFLIPQMCDAVDDLNYERLSEISNKIIYARPQKMHDMANYQLEKIFSYLGDEVGLNMRDENYKYGLRQAELFSMEFAKKWVTIKPYNMEGNEILLLVRVACYFECKEQNKVV